MLPCKILLTLAVGPGQMNCTPALDEADHLTDSALGRYRKQNVNVAGLQVTLHDRALLLLGQTTEHLAQTLPQFLVQLLAPVHAVI